MIVSSIWMQRTLVACLCIAALACHVLQAEDSTADHKVRTWTDITGKFHIEASFEGYNIGLVDLRKIDDTLISVPLKELSSSDQRYVRYELRQRRVVKSSDKSEAETVAESANVKSDSDEKEDAEAITKTKKIAGIDWHCTVDSVQAAANSDDGKQRPVMWFRVLGDMEGFM